MSCGGSHLSSIDEFCYLPFLEVLLSLQVLPTQVEGILRGHPGVKDCAVVGRKCAERGEVVAAFVVKSENHDVSDEELKAFAASRLTRKERLDGGVRFVKQLPKSPAGKMLRRALIPLLEDRS